MPPSLFENIRGDARNWVVNSIMTVIGSLILLPIATAILKAIREEPVPWGVLGTITAVGVILLFLVLGRMRKPDPPDTSQKHDDRPAIEIKDGKGNTIVEGNTVITDGRPFLRSENTENLEVLENFYRDRLFNVPQPAVEALARLAKFRNQGLQTLDCFSLEHPTQEFVDTWWDQVVSAASANALSSHVKLYNLKDLKHGEVDTSPAVKKMGELFDLGKSDWLSNPRRCDLFIDLWSRVERINHLIAFIEG